MTTAQKSFVALIACCALLCGCRIAKKAEPVVETGLTGATGLKTAARTQELNPENHVHPVSQMLPGWTVTNWNGKECWLAPGYKWRKTLPPEPPASEPPLSSPLPTANVNVITFNPTNMSLRGTHGVSLPLKFNGGMERTQIWTNGVMASDFETDTSFCTPPLLADDPNTKIVIIKMTP